MEMQNNILFTFLTLITESRSETFCKNPNYFRRDNTEAPIVRVSIAYI